MPTNKSLQEMADHINHSLKKIYQSPTQCQSQLNFINKYDWSRNGMCTAMSLDEILVTCIRKKNLLTIAQLSFLLDKGHYLKQWKVEKFGAPMHHTITYLVQLCNQNIARATDKYTINEEYHETDTDYFEYPVISGINDYKSRIVQHLKATHSPTLIATAFFKHALPQIAQPRVDKIENKHLELIMDYCV